MRPAAALLLFAGLAIAGTAPAAPWDCPKRAGIAEPLACGDTQLATLEAQVATAVSVAAAKLSAAGRSRLQGDQADWRKYLATLCLGELQPGGGSPADCLKQEYDVRRAQLTRAVEITGGVTLMRNERFDARPAQVVEDSARPVLTGIAWPQLDRAATAAQRRWNELMEKGAAQLAVPLDRQNPDTDISVDYRIESVGTELIQTVFYRDLYIHGAAHGDDMTVSSLFLIRPARALTAEDLFDPAKSWRPALAALAYGALVEAARQEAWRLWPRNPADLADLVAEPSRWLLKPDGLALHFDPYEVGDYAAGMHDVLIPWPALDGYLPASPALRLPPR